MAALEPGAARARRRGLAEDQGRASIVAAAAGRPSGRVRVAGGRSADRTDVPAFKIVSSETLMDLVDRHPATVEELRAVKGLSPRVHREAEASWSGRARRALPEDRCAAHARRACPVVSEGDAAPHQTPPHLAHGGGEEARPRRVCRPPPAPARARGGGGAARPRTSKPSKACCWRRDTFGEALPRVFAGI